MGLLSRSIGRTFNMPCCIIERCNDVHYNMNARLALNQVHISMPIGPRRCVEVRHQGLRNGPGRPAAFGLSDSFLPQVLAIETFRSSLANVTSMSQSAGPRSYVMVYLYDIRRRLRLPRVSVSLPSSCRSAHEVLVNIAMSKKHVFDSPVGLVEKSLRSVITLHPLLRL